MKYEKEVKQLFRDAFYESWMDDEDWVEFEAEVFKAIDSSYEKMSKDIEVGVSNGYSVEFQIKLVKDLFRSLSKHR
jgi:hypothetical protein